MPTQGWLSSAFSAMRAHPILHLARPHEGIDVSAPMGSPIEAPAAGVVTEAGWETGYGNTITINHGYGIVTKFAHASKLLVKNGQRVARGQRIALAADQPHAVKAHNLVIPFAPSKQLFPHGGVSKFHVVEHQVIVIAFFVVNHFFPITIDENALSFKVDSCNEQFFPEMKTG